MTFLNIDAKNLCLKGTAQTKLIQKCYLQLVFILYIDRYVNDVSVRSLPHETAGKLHLNVQSFPVNFDTGNVKFDPRQ